ncbi:COG4705 family protein [Cysteiniphilum halobium]|uniref:COG4705 family protein n=1 Tax=Cysteiniphilum halobium TaxID=2219059 RepID=UPI003F83CBDE
MNASMTSNRPVISFNKVASITAFFWIIKIISTTVGEASADFMYSLSAPIAVVSMFFILLAAIIIQIKFKRYVPWMYWTVIVLIAVFGTMFSDAIHYFVMPLIGSTSMFLGLLLLTLYMWYKSEGSIDPHYINTTKREIFYWVVIFFTFCLGTASGDFVAHSLHFGLMDATIFFGIFMIAIPIILYLFKINSIALFWITYILTRPFGAAGADLIGKPSSHGGFGLGDGNTALIFLGVIIILVTYLTISSRKEMLIEEHIDVDSI